MLSGPLGSKFQKKSEAKTGFHKPRFYNFPFFVFFLQDSMLASATRTTHADAEDLDAGDVNEGEEEVGEDDEELVE